MNRMNPQIPHPVRQQNARVALDRIESELLAMLDRAPDSADDVKVDFARNSMLSAMLQIRQLWGLT